MQFQEPPIKSQRPRMNPAILPGIVGAVIGLVGLGVGLHGLNQAEQMARTQTAATTSVEAMQQQVNSLTQRINQQETKERDLSSQLATAQNAAAQSPTAPQSTTPQTAMPTSSQTTEAQSAVDDGVTRIAAPSPAKKRRVVKVEPKKPVEDPRIQELEKKFDEHARKFSEQDGKLADNQRLIESTRTDLEGQLTEKSGELAGSIAKTSEEVAELRKRGERDYFEFDLTKSKQVQRVGPVSLALRKADTKHKRYNLDMIVDDNKLEKKNVSMLEPVYVTASDRQQPLEVVVNRMDKDRVSGYVSVPKYKRSEMTPAENGRSTMTLPTETSPEK